MQYENNLISIVIITCNRENELKKAIESCIEFADMNCEIIVVDNNSNDGTKEMIKNIVAPVHIKLRPFFMDYNLGVAGARNYGLNMANSRVVFFLDDDAYFAENSLGLSFAYNYLLENSSIFALATEIYNLQTKDYQKDTYDKINHNKVFSFIGASHFIRKDYVNRKDLYPEKLFYGNEERYACLGAYKQGYDIEYNSNIKVIHNPSISTRSTAYENLRNIVINKYINKRLTLPIVFQIFSTILFYLRLIKLCRFNLNKYYECYSLYKKRFEDNKYAINRINFKISIELIKRFGINKIL